MSSLFIDHPRKQTVREKWNTPILTWLYRKWGAKYLYLGLPGPEAHDIKLWAEMIERVIAFEITDDTKDNPRENFERLSANLTLMKLPHTVYHGNLEDVVLWKRDLDEKEFTIDKFITLFNLDFCNSITGKVPTPNGRKCWRFETIREIITIQRALFRTTGVSKFVMLITVYDAFHRREMDRFIARQDLASDIRTSVSRERAVKVPDSTLYQNTELLRLFVFDFLRGCFAGQNIKSFFLPAVKFSGRTPYSPMIHFCVVCEMENMESAQVVDEQNAGDFVNMGIVTADNAAIRRGRDDLVDPLVSLKNTWVGQ